MRELALRDENNDAVEIAAHLQENPHASRITSKRGEVFSSLRKERVNYFATVITTDLKPGTLEGRSQRTVRVLAYAHFCDGVDGAIHLDDE